jgi:hypothetical protein
VLSLTAQRAPKAVALFPETAARTKLDELEDYIINGLRLLSEGIDFSKLEAEFGRSICLQVLATFQKSGLDELGHVCVDFGPVDHRPLRMRMTPEGAKFESSVLTALLCLSKWEF